MVAMITFLGAQKDTLENSWNKSCQEKRNYFQNTFPKTFSTFWMQS